jgi:hypothetical protein
MLSLAADREREGKLETSPTHIDQESTPCAKCNKSLMYHPTAKPDAPAKRKRSDGEDYKDDELPEAKRLCEELEAHPLYEKDAPKVTLVSSDGPMFSVDKRTLSTYR